MSIVLEFQIFGRIFHIWGVCTLLDGRFVWRAKPSACHTFTGFRTSLIIAGSLYHWVAGQQNRSKYLWDTALSLLHDSWIFFFVFGNLQKECPYRFTQEYQQHQQAKEKLDVGGELPSRLGSESSIAVGRFFFSSRTRHAWKLFGTLSRLSTSLIDCKLFHDFWILHIISTAMLLPVTNGLDLGALEAIDPAKVSPLQL